MGMNQKTVRHKKKGRAGKVVLTIVAILILLFIASPAIAVVGASFSNTKVFSFPPQGFSLQWYDAAFHNREHLNALSVSLKLALVVTLMSGLICVPACFALKRGTKKITKAVSGLFTAPLFLPTIALGVGLMLWFAKSGLRGKFWSLVFAHVVIVTPYYVRVVGSSLDTFNYTLVEAANSLGAKPTQAFLHVTLPSVMPGIIVSSMFAFMLSFSDVVITMFITSSRLTTFPVRVYASMITEGLNPMVLAYSAIIIVIALVASLLAEKFAHWSKYF